MWSPGGSINNPLVAIVSPETGLFDEPTIPAIYAASHENIKAIIITSIVTNAVYDELINIELYILYIDQLFSYYQHKNI